MLIYKMMHTTPAIAVLTGALALGLIFDQRPVLAEQMRCGGSSHEHHHPVAAGVERKLASYTVPDVTLTDQNGRKISLTELLNSDQPVMLNFIFTSCTAICPAMSATFASVQKRLGSDSEKLHMISVSIDPEYDTPEALKAYAERFKAGPQWAFLTGSQDDSIAVQKAFDADRGDKMNHAPLTLIRATHDSQWIRYEGFASAAKLAKEIQNML
jgi:protein SCO1